MSSVSFEIHITHPLKPEDNVVIIIIRHANLDILRNHFQSLKPYNVFIKGPILSCIFFA